jgi:hypothetical protein
VKIASTLGVKVFGVTFKSESANFVSLRFCVLDNNIRDIKCVLSCAGLSDEEMPGRIIRPGVAG